MPRERAALGGVPVLKICEMAPCGTPGRCRTPRTVTDCRATRRRSPSTRRGGRRAGEGVEGVVDQVAEDRRQRLHALGRLAEVGVRRDHELDAALVRLGRLAEQQADDQRRADAGAERLVEVGRTCRGSR